MINTTNKLILGLLAAATVGFAVGNKPSDVILHAVENVDKIELTNIPIAETVVESGTFTYRSKYNPNYCPRTEDGRVAVEPTVIVDDSLPLHCLEKDCGLGVYSKHKGEPDEVERCSFCGARKPVNL